jgi:hypothetical protein
MGHKYINIDSSNAVRHKNRSEAFDPQRVIGSEMIESGYDASFVIDERKIRLSM